MKKLKNQEIFNNQRKKFNFMKKKMKMIKLWNKNQKKKTKFMMKQNI